MTPELRRTLEGTAKRYVDDAQAKEKEAVEHEKQAGELRSAAAKLRALGACPDSVVAKVGVE